MTELVTDEEEAEFVKELTELTKKHKIVIWGCGCCNSPTIYRPDPVVDGSYVLGEYAYLEWKKNES